MKRWISTLVLSILSLMFVQCEDKKESNLIKAQACINKATAATVNACLSSIEGQTSKRSFVLRCSAAFISEGIDEDAIIAAIRNIDGSKNTGNPTTPALAALTMSDIDISTAAVEVCTQSGSQALIALSNFANLSTSLSDLLGFVKGDDADAIESLIASYNAGTADNDAKVALGNAVVVAQSSLCNSTNGLFKKTDVCNDIDSAVNENPGEAADITDALLINLKDTP